MNISLKLSKIVAGYTLASLADAAGVGYDRLRNICYEGRLPTQDEAKRIANILHRPVAALFPEVKS